MVLDIFIPVPSSLVNTLADALLGLSHGAFSAWAGMTLGCAIANWVGSKAGTPFVRELVGQVELHRAAAISKKIGFASHVVSRGVPVLAEASTVAAGIVSYPFRKFVVITGIGNAAIAGNYAGLGVYAHEQKAFLLAFAAAILLPTVCSLLYRFAFRKS
ncbi:VTT domain-containing protein [uncultured Roseobacter sp.]|uniref:VTT domain-containing protein n=1 Tax=uncultured Roseobacter sp. TaxID=114847 RepID=UPI00260841F5|nr:VTT domain-containing protein [uncultured Roseobacter sp.]